MTTEPVREPVGAVVEPWARRLLVAEIVIVLSLSLGRSAVYALVDLVATATSGGSLASHDAVLNSSLAPGRPTLDLVLQLLSVVFGLAPVALVWYLTARTDRALSPTPWRRGAGLDAARGAVLAAAVGSVGLAFYLLARASGANLTVVASALPDVWWRLPVLVLSALQNALLEEVVMLGYLVRCLRRLGWSPQRAVVTSAVIRGSYHLYQGLGGFVGNLAMGLLFGWLFTRWGRVRPLVIAHALIDTVAFIGYALLVGRVGWLS